MYTHRVTARNKDGSSRSYLQRVHGSRKNGVDFDTVKEKASSITPVPGGVGPTTATLFMMNLLKAAKIAEGLQ